jgi:hypothetical protein
MHPIITLTTLLLTVGGGLLFIGIPFSIVVNLLNSYL